MRRIDKKLNMMKANLMVEQRYLQSKGLISEMMYPVDAGGEKKMAFAEGKDGVPSNLEVKLKEAGVNPSDVETVTLITPEGKKIKTIQPDENLEEGKLKNLAMVCIITAAGVIQSCSKQETTFGFNSNVHGVEYEIDSKNGTDEIEVVNFNGEIKKYKAVKQKDQQGNASGGVAVKEKPTEFEIAIFSFGKTLQEEERSNRSSNDGETVVDYSIEKPIMNVGYTASPARSIKDLSSFKDAMKFIRNGDSKHNVDEAIMIFNQEMKKAHAKGVFSEPIDVDYAGYATSNY